MGRMREMDELMFLFYHLARFIKDPTQENLEKFKIFPLYKEKFIKLRAVVLGFLENLKKLVNSDKKVIFYDEIIKEANKYLVEKDINLKLPETGNYVGKVAGDGVGLVSYASGIIYNCLFSSVVVKRGTEKPGEGYFSLKETLGITKTDEEMRKETINWAINHLKDLQIL